MSDKIITKADIKDFTFLKYRKKKDSKISSERLPIGTKVETLEGYYVCQEPSRLAVDEGGNVYPIAESIFEKTYELSEEKDD